MTDFVILTEAGGTVGYGHLMRCLAIANVTDAELYVHADGDYPKKNCSKEYNWRTYLDGLIDSHPASSSILVDSYLADRKIYERLSQYFNYVSVLDDYNRLEYPVDLIINPGIKLPDYSSQVAKVVGGNKYIILRKEIVQQQKKYDYHHYQNVLVTFGGCDNGNLYDWLVPLLGNHPFSLITVVTGNDENGSLLATKYNSSLIKWCGQVDAQHMGELMYQADICISAGGQTLHELAYIGVPSICIKTGEDQKNNIEGYIKAGFIQESLSLKTIDLSQRVQHLLNVCGNAALRKLIAKNGKAIVDGKGVGRIVDFTLLFNSGE